MPNGIPQAIYPVVYAGDVRATRTGSQPSTFSDGRAPVDRRAPPMGARREALMGMLIAR